ncbi:hypothetical protein FBZ98_1011009 [Rhizobium sp. ERR 922]|uniref:DUF2312 domain-containing protein n=1 Tax=unclassified Rhizobium TaxID=2613769 RepID=UPI0011A2A9BF|nr:MULTISPECIES: DUF2312 domain-containing protein [unclassified Rhizobium]TWB61664.1 hypothetical protein FBZ98_1011009 [Rhizobium sp. ERR 922]TWC04590.1 hypothetical protein FBZ97_1011009 [Rhizobium sp. ERR 942]
MITRTSLANEIDEYDQQIADMNSGKKDCFDAYRAQLIAGGMDKANIKTEIEAVKAAIKRRRAAKKDPMAVEEKDALIDEIFEEITTSPRAPRATREKIEKFDPETGEILEDINPHLAKQIVDGMQTEAGRAALMTAVDILIERDEAEEQNAPRPSINDEPSPEAGPQAEASPAGTGSGTLADRDGRHEGEAVSAGLPTNSEIAPASQGEAEAPSAERVSPTHDTSSAVANTGGDHVTASSNHAASQAGAIVNPAPAIKHRFRPNCQHRDHCKSGTVDHCHSCKVAMREGDAA